MDTTKTTDARFHDLLEDFDAAMLVTRTPDGHLRSRPMALAQVEENGDLWFLTQRGSGKTDEISQNQQVNVALQSPRRFVSLSGAAQLVDDRAKVAQLWTEDFKVWFPGGQDDPSLLLVRVRGEQGEYWDNSGARGLRYLIEAGKAYLTGTRPGVDDDPTIHAKVELGNKV